MATLTLTGTATDDTIVINATGTDSGTYSINGGAAVAFSGVTRVVVIGEDGNDTLSHRQSRRRIVRADRRDQLRRRRRPRRWA